MRLARSLTRLAGTLPYSLAVGALGIALLTPSGAAGRPAPVPHRSAASRVRGARTAACNGLSAAKQVQAVKDFAQMLPVFRHPRCMNCHGGLDPLSDKHPGKDQISDLVNNRDKFLEECQTCHDGLPGWRQPGEPVFFTGKDDETLCLQMKRFEPKGDGFVEHIRNDHGDIQFIAAGFTGDRALGEGLKDYDLVAEPPPGTQADLTAKAQKWVDDLGDHYADSPECGCVVPKIKLEVHNVMVSNTPGGLPSREASDVKFEVNLLPLGEDKPGGYMGEASLARAVQVTVPGNCKVTGASINEHWTFYAILAPQSDSMQVWQTQMTDDPEGAIECKISTEGGWGTRRLKGGTGTMKTEEMWNESSLANEEPFMMPSDSGATKEFSEGEGGPRGDLETLTVKVLEVPAGK